MRRRPCERKRHSERQRVNHPLLLLVTSYKKYFRRSVEAHFPLESERLMTEIEAEYQALEGDIRFARSSNNPLDERLDISAYFLSLIKVLDREGESYERVRQMSLDIARDYVRPKNKLQAMLKRLPVKLIGTTVSRVLLRYLDRRISGRGHPDGFVANIITDKEETYGLGYGVDILECGICKLFAKHDCGRYAAILCEVDYITTSLAGLELVRTGTIATGAETCDFRFKRDAGDT